jgi:hypothetical protein
VRDTGEVGFPQLAIVMAALADLAFTGAVAVHVAFHDLWGWGIVLAVIASALLFVAATIMALAAKRRATVIVAILLVALAGLGALVAAANGGLRYQAVRRQNAGDQFVQSRQTTGAMLSGVSASLAAVTALPLAGYLAYGVFRADHVS